MISHFQKKYALSKEGASDLVKGIIWTIFSDFSFMLPVILSMIFFDGAVKLLLDQGPVPQKSLSFYALLGLGFLIVMYAISYFQYASLYTKIYDESSKRRIILAETLRKLPLSFFAKKDLSDLSATIMDDATQIETLFSHAVPQLYAAFISLILMAVLLFSYHLKLSLALFWVIPVGLLVFLLSRKFQRNLHQKIYAMKREITDEIQQSLEGAQEIKAYNQEATFNQRIKTALYNYEAFLIQNELLSGALINLAQAFLKLGLPSVLLYGAYAVSKGEASIFTYLVFLIISARIYNPIMEVMNNLALLLYLDVRIQRMKEMDEMPRQEGEVVFSPKHYDIEFNGVDFSYGEGIQTLKNVSLTAKQGEITALVGPSGGGKSTVAKLAARFWDIDGGSITLGGQNIAHIEPEALLQNYAIVFQDVTLFNSSILENIRLGKKDASDEAVMEAARLAQCEEFVQKLPQGYHTLIGENGEKLSGGERQRISIARAILKDAPIILMDEATASLDTENESKIQRALSVLIREKTVIIIAHRMRTVLGADKIIVIKEGKIEEWGAPKTLKEKNGLFAAMLKTQMES